MNTSLTSTQLDALNFLASGGSTGGLFVKGKIVVNKQIGLTDDARIRGYTVNTWFRLLIKGYIEGRAGRIYLTPLGWSKVQSNKLL